MICARLGRPASSAECCETISTTQNQSDLATCRACPEGMAIMGTARIGNQEDTMPNGKCECCGNKGVIYRRGGVSRCYSCHKTQAEPMGLPANPTIEDSPMPAVPPVPATEDVTRPMPRTPDPWPGKDADAAAQDEETTAPAAVLAWDDFTPYRPAKTTSHGMFARVEEDKINLSAEVSRAVNFAPGQRVEIAYNLDTKAVAMRLSRPSAVHTAKVYGKEGASVSVSCKTLIGQLGLQPRTRYPVEIQSWGLIVRGCEAA